MKTAVKTLIEELNNQLDVSQIARLENLFVEILELEKSKTLSFAAEYYDLSKYGYMRKTPSEYYDEFFNENQSEQ